MNRKKELLDYIQKSTHWQVASQNIAIDLPLYIQASYELWGAKIEGVNILFAHAKDESMDIRLHQNAVKRLGEISDTPVVLVFEKLNARNVESLIKKNIAFIIQDKQIYMPFVLLEIKTPPIKNTFIKPSSLSHDADTILIGYLDCAIANGWMIKEIAKAINRELRATSKALKLLEALGYLHIEVEGRSQRIYFIPQMEIYERLKQEGVSPIKYTFFAKEFAKDSVESGMSALSHYSTLVDEKIKSVAISHKMINAKELEALQCEEDESKLKVEVWDRDPSVFAYNGVINPLYLLRFFGQEEDERVEEAIENIEKQIVEKFEEKNETK